jgi:response regulator RpfG family c-di-GMP phosphodiesterase
MKRDILYVDDEVDNLIVFQATFDEHFNVVTANGGREALDLLASRAFPAVVADHRMPRMTGAELFEIMRQKFPHTKRIMLTGYADSKAMLSAINQGQVFYFVKKPWEQDALFSILVRAIEAYDLSLSNMMLQDRLVAADRCAMLGRSAAQLAHEMGNQLCMAGFARTTHERLVQIINEVKAFVRFERESVTTQGVPLAAVVHELVEFLRYERTLPLTRLNVEIRSEPWAKVNRVKLQQVVLNLLKNAAFAIRDCSAGQITLSLDADGERAVIVVADNGCGMPAEVAKSIVEAHGGTIECETAPQCGAKFTIRLPKWEPAAKPTESARAVVTANLDGPLTAPAAV